jgi:hypothetical protein
VDLTHHRGHSAYANIFVGRADNIIQANGGHGVNLTGIDPSGFVFESNYNWLGSFNNVPQSLAACTRVVMATL